MSIELTLFKDYSKKLPSESGNRSGISQIFSSEMKCCNDTPPVCDSTNSDCNSVAKENFHTRLARWGQANDSDDLAKRTFIRLHKKITEENNVFIRIEKYLNKNTHKLKFSDLAALENLRVLINTSLQNEKLEKNRNDSLKLIHTIQSCINLTKSMSQGFLASAANELTDKELSTAVTIINDTTAEYLSFEDLFKFSLAGNNVSSKALKKAFLAADESDLLRFIFLVISNIENNTYLFNRGIYYFFSNASSKLQEKFFSELKCNAEILSKIIVQIPKKIVALNFQGCSKIFNSNHLRLIFSHFKQIRSLDLSHCVLDEEVLYEMAQNPKMNHLRELILDNITFSDSGNVSNGILSIVKSSNFCSLRHLSLFKCNSSKIALEIIKNPNLSNLNSLSLCKCDLDNKFLIALKKSNLISRLKNLDLSCNKQLNGTEFISFIQSPGVTNLETLDLKGCKLGEEEFIAIAQSPFLLKLKKLRLGGDYFDGANLNNLFIFHLAANENIKNLEYLDLDHAQLDDSAIMMLSNCAKFNKLKFLKFSGNKALTDDALSCMATSKTLQSLKWMDIKHCRIFVEGKIKEKFSENGILKLVESRLNSNFFSLNHDVNISKFAREKLQEMFKHKGKNLEIIKHKPKKFMDMKSWTYFVGDRNIG